MGREGEKHDDGKREVNGVPVEEQPFHLVKDDETTHQGKPFGRCVDKLVRLGRKNTGSFDELTE